MKIKLIFFFNKYVCLQIYNLSKYKQPIFQNSVILMYISTKIKFLLGIYKINII